MFWFFVLKYYRVLKAIDFQNKEIEDYSNPNKIAKIPFSLTGIFFFENLFKF